MESTPYSCLNLFFVSFRGMIFPFLGQLIYSWSNAFVLFYLAGGLCLLSVVYALSLNQRSKFAKKHMDNVNTLQKVFGIDLEFFS